MPNRSLLYPELLTESAVTKSFADFFSQNVRYDHSRRKFLLWDTHYWQEDRTGGISRLIVSFSEMMMKEGERTDDKQLYGWGIKIQSAAKINNIMSLSKSTHPISLSGTEFDTNPMLLGVQNGIIDLTSGKLRNGKPSDYISMISPVTYDASATSPLWEEFINTIFEGDAELIDWVRRVLGYSITGDMREQMVFLLYGTGGNGKSRLLDVLAGILGDHMQKTPSEFFNKQTFFHQINDASFMRNKRIIFNSENTANVTLNTELLKSISSPDMQRGRQLYENAIDFMPICKMFISTNNLPHFEDDSWGFERRIKVIPFEHRFSGSADIKDYHKILLTQAPGILNWLIDSCLMWQEKGLSDTPTAVTKATMGYKKSNNPLNEYIEDRIVKEAGEFVLCSAIYSDYQLWMQRRREVPLSRNIFGRHMTELGFNRTEKAEWIYLGIRLHLNS